MMRGGGSGGSRIEYDDDSLRRLRGASEIFAGGAEEDLSRGG